MKTPLLRPQPKNKRSKSGTEASSGILLIKKEHSVYPGSMKKYLLITFDYELFLGPRSGNVRECLLEPTEGIRSILSKKNVHAIFFVDTTYLITLQQYSERHAACKKDLQAIEEQLQNLVRDGHYIFPHIHPHWLDAKYLENEHQFTLQDISRYRFHKLKQEEKDYLFHESIRTLLDIARKVKPDYQIDGYRAGGWSLQPFADYKPYFEKFGIRYDFSVMTGMYQFSNAQFFDFSAAPRKPVYRFSGEVTTEDSKGPFLEMGSSVIRIPRAVFMLHRLHHRFLVKMRKDHTYGRGVGQQSKPLPGFKPANIEGFPTTKKLHEAASAELLSIAKMPSYLNYFRDHQYLCFVSHPKMLSNHNLRMLENFLDKAFEEHEIETDFHLVAQQLEPSLEADIKALQNKRVLNNNELTVSVVIPCYNVSVYIEEALRSVLAQTYQPVEIICVDDHSTDETVAIINRLQKEFPDKITIMANDRNRGATYTRNRGLAVARGEYIQFFDADDIMHPYKLEHHVNCILDAQIRPDILVGSCDKLFINGFLKKYIYKERNPWCALMEAAMGTTSSNLFRRDKLVEANGWSEALKSSQEYDLMFRMLQHNATVKFDQRIASTNRERPHGSITKANPTENWKRYIDLRNRAYVYLKENNKVTPEIERSYLNCIFDAIRILYKYDPVEAKRLHKAYVMNKGIPGVTISTTKRYLTFYKLLGFRGAEVLSDIVKRTNQLVD